jgi:hypothetical protein
MFENIKITIKELAKSAVVIAEKTLGSNKGKEKKKMAIEYIINRLPVPILFKPLVCAIFNSFIDEAVEFAVEYMEAL